MPSLPTLEALLDRDLDHVVDALAGEWPALAGRRLLITGGAGFLGYYLVHAIVHFNRGVGRANPIELTVWDSFMRGRPGWLDKMLGEPHCTIETVDMKAPLPRSMPDFDWIIHAAGVASPTYYRQFPLETMDANIVGLRNLLEHGVGQADRGRPLQGFLFFSSSEIYGDPTPDWIPTPEHFRGLVSCTGPRACYDESKRYGETLCVVFAGRYGLPTKMARPFNNYGPGLKISDRRVIPDFAREIFAGRDLVMFSDGRPTRTFCYAADAIVGYYKTLVRGRPGEPYNIGIETPEISMRELGARLVALGAELFGYRGQWVMRPSSEEAYLVDNPMRRCPDIRKAREELGYNPMVGIDEGLRRTLVWYHHNREGSDA